MASPTVVSRIARTRSAGPLLSSGSAPFSFCKSTISQTASYTTFASRSILKDVCLSKSRSLGSLFNWHGAVNCPVKQGSNLVRVRFVSGFGLSGFDGGDPPSLGGRSKWDAPEQPAGTKTTATTAITEPKPEPSSPSPSPSAPQPTKASSRGRSKAEILADVNKELSNAPEGSQAIIKSNLKKLEALSKVTRMRQAYSPYIIISKLPSTVMPDDIHRMAVTKDSIVDIIYHRNTYLEFSNRITVVFRSATDAVEFLTQKYGKFLAGHKLIMRMLDPYNATDKRLIPPQLSPEPLSGQLVLVSGLPAASKPDNLRTEFRRFHLMDTTEAAIVPIPSRKLSSTCQYLIRLSSRSEAFRFVRTYHNSFYNHKEYRKRCPIRAIVIY
ncbi:hypothetical protein BGZ83_005443 [Gryganskiella cystojenkinii]|nr:hypothetical protein BGZ83_005443 [Gryganskiella cystojenkinii]